MAIGKLPGKVCTEYVCLYGKSRCCCAGRRRHARDSLRHAEEMASLHLRTIEALALAIEAKDSTTADHLERVQTYAIEIGKEMGLSREELSPNRSC